MKTLQNLTNGMTVLQVELAILFCAAFILLIIAGIVSIYRTIVKFIKAKLNKPAKRQNLFKEDPTRLDAKDALYSFALMIIFAVAYFAFGSNL